MELQKAYNFNYSSQRSYAHKFPMHNAKNIAERMPSTEEISSFVPTKLPKINMKYFLIFYHL